MKNKTIMALGFAGLLSLVGTINPPRVEEAPNKGGLEISVLKEQKKDSDYVHFNDILREKLRENSEFALNEHYRNKIDEFNELPKIERYISMGYNHVDVPDYIPESFIRAIVRIESEDNPNAVGKHGEKGYMQIREPSWYEVEEASFDEYGFNPQQNITVGIKYINWIDNALEKLHPNWDNLDDMEKRNMIIGAYNAGIGSLINGNLANNLAKEDWNLKKLPERTQNYAERAEILNNYFSNS